MSNSTAVLHLIVAGTNTTDTLAAATGKTKKQIVKFAQTLKKLGYVSVCDNLDAEFGSGARGMYFATEAGNAFAASGETIKPGKAGERPRKKTVGLREKAWWHLRAHKVATLKDLLSTHATGTEKDAESNLYKYLFALEMVGIIKRLPMRQAAHQSKGRIVWNLEKDLGMKAPVWRQVAKEVYDPNGDKAFAIPDKAKQGEGE